MDAVVTDYFCPVFHKVISNIRARVDERIAILQYNPITTMTTKKICAYRQPQQKRIQMLWDTL